MPPSYATESTLAHVCLVISTFRQDESVLGLLRGVYGDGTTHPFCKIIVVDSLGSGAISDAIDEAGWEDIIYENASTNLGAAGNHFKRLTIASEQSGARWAYAVNDDGEVKLDALNALLKHANAQPDQKQLGALYPLRYTTHLQKYNLTGKTRLPIPYVGTTVKPTKNFPVYWASSNGALYHLEPVRSGLLPWVDLWHGWEDRGYGLLLDDHGWRQEVVCDAVFEDGYEYEAHGSGNAQIRISDKPTWYAYYQMRNLILITQRTASNSLTWSVVAGRVALEFGLSATLRKDKKRRMQFLLAGIRDGLLGKAGKWKYP